MDILSLGWQAFEQAKSNDTKPEPIHSVAPQRVFTTQLVITLVSGVFIFLLFCFLRYKWPNIYAVRILRQPSGNPHTLRPLPKNLFGWIKVVYKITDEEIISCAGLDTYVYLCFSKWVSRSFCLINHGNIYTKSNSLSFYRKL